MCLCLCVSFLKIYRETHLADPVLSTCFWVKNYKPNKLTNLGTEVARHVENAVKLSGDKLRSWFFTGNTGVRRDVGWKRGGVGLGRGGVDFSVGGG